MVEELVFNCVDSFLAYRCGLNTTMETKILADKLYENDVTTEREITMRFWEEIKQWVINNLDIFREEVELLILSINIILKENFKKPIKLDMSLIDKYLNKYHEELFTNK